MKIIDRYISSEEIFKECLRGRFLTSWLPNGDFVFTAKRTQDVIFVDPNELNLSEHPDWVNQLDSLLPSPIIDSISRFAHEPCFNKIIARLAEAGICTNSPIPLNTRVRPHEFLTHLSFITRCHILVINGSEIHGLVPKGRLQLSRLAILHIEDEDVDILRRSIISDRHSRKSYWVHGRAKFSTELEYFHSMEILMDILGHDGTMSSTFRPGRANLNRTNYEVLMICCKKVYESLNIGRMYWKVDPIRKNRVDNVLAELEERKSRVKLISTISVPDVQIADFNKLLKKEVQVLDPVESARAEKRAESEERRLMAEEDEDVVFEKWQRILAEIQERNYPTQTLDVNKYKAHIVEFQRRRINNLLRQSRSEAEREKYRKLLQGDLFLFEGIPSDLIAKYREMLLKVERFEIFQEKDEVLAEVANLNQAQIDRSRANRQRVKQGLPKIPYEATREVRDRNRELRRKDSILMTIEDDLRDVNLSTTRKDENGVWYYKCKKSISPEVCVPVKRVKNQKKIIQPPVYKKSVIYVKNPDYIDKKRIGILRYEQLQNTVNLKMAEVIKNGAYVDHMFKSISRRSQQVYRSKYPGSYSHTDRMKVMEMDSKKFGNRSKKLFGMVDSIKKLSSATVTEDLDLKASENFSMRAFFYSICRTGIPVRFSKLSHNDMLLAITRASMGLYVQRLKNERSKFGTGHGCRRYIADVILENIET